MDRLTKLKMALDWGFRVLLLITVVVAVFLHHWLNMAFALMILFLTFLPDILERRFQIGYPSELKILILFFIFGSMYLGEIHDYYYEFPWWDTLLHGMSAIIMGGIAFSLVFILNKSKKVAFQLSPLFVAVFAFSFSLSMGAVWEIFEFSMDQFLGTNMQKSGLMDTMGDLIVDTCGSLLFAVIGFLHMKNNISIFDWLEKKFFQINPELRVKTRGIK